MHAVLLACVALAAGLIYRGPRDKPPDWIALEGGGVKGIAIGGAIAGLEGKYGSDFTTQVKGFAGTSAGSQAAMLLAAGYSGKELTKALTEIDVKELLTDNYLVDLTKKQNIKTLMEYFKKHNKALANEETCNKYVEGKGAADIRNLGMQLFDKYDELPHLKAPPASGGHGVLLEGVMEVLKKITPWFLRQQLMNFIKSHDGCIDTDGSGDCDISEINTMIQKGCTEGGLFSSMGPLKQLLCPDFFIFKGDALQHELENLLAQKLGDHNRDITFEELYKETKKVLRLVGTNLRTGGITWFDYKSTPNMPVAKAARASSAIPFFFNAVEHEVLAGDPDVFVDGGCMKNLPFDAFDNAIVCSSGNEDCSGVDKPADRKEYVLALTLGKDEKLRVQGGRAKLSRPDNLIDYMQYIIATIQDGADSGNSLKDAIRRDDIEVLDLHIGNISAIDFELDGIQQTWLVLQGWCSVVNWAGRKNGVLDDCMHTPLRHNGESDPAYSINYVKSVSSQIRNCAHQCGGNTYTAPKWLNTSIEKALIQGLKKAHKLQETVPRMNAKASSLCSALDAIKELTDGHWLVSPLTKLKQIIDEAREVYGTSVVGLLFVAYSIVFWVVAMVLTWSIASALVTTCPGWFVCGALIGLASPETAISQLSGTLIGSDYSCSPSKTSGALIGGLAVVMLYLVIKYFRQKDRTKVPSKVERIFFVLDSDFDNRISDAELDTFFKFLFGRQTADEVEQNEPPRVHSKQTRFKYWMKKYAPDGELDKLQFMKCLRHMGYSFDLITKGSDFQKCKSAALLAAATWD
jgi:predicted acylesterase/phospholipase RssA